MGVRGLDVLSRAAVAVAAGTDFVVERAVDFVCFSAKDGGEVVRHGGWRCFDLRYFEKLRICGDTWDEVAGK